MIFVTVGTQLPFPRLIDALEKAASELSSINGEELVVQSCAPDLTSDYFISHPMLPPERFSHFFQTADIIIGHAGIGTILAARKYSKPLIIFPRRAKWKEHRNDHQFATAQQVQNMAGLYVAQDADQLLELLRRNDLEPMADAESAGRKQLRNRVRDFINESSI